MSRSFVYRNLWVYRSVMTVLYKGQYRERFRRVCWLIRESDATVLELCFGDVEVAGYCRTHGKRWVGLDASDEFVAYAANKGFDARIADLLQKEALPVCDVCIMMGSLYHFKSELPVLFQSIKGVSSRFVLSEPVRNWTHSNRLLRFLARALTRTDAREESFRFDETSLIQTLDDLKNKVGFEYRVVSVARDMVLEVIWSK